MKTINLSQEQLRRIICQLRRQLASLTLPPKDDNRISSDDYELRSVVFNVPDNLQHQFLPHDPQRTYLQIVVTLNSGGSTIWPDTPNGINVPFLPFDPGTNAFFAQDVGMWAYRNPALVKSAWFIVQPAGPPTTVVALMERLVR